MFDCVASDPKRMTVYDYIPQGDAVEDQHGDFGLMVFHHRNMPACLAPLVGIQRHPRIANSDKFANYPLLSKMEISQCNTDGNKPNVVQNVENIVWTDFVSQAKTCVKFNIPLRAALLFGTMMIPTLGMGFLFSRLLCDLCVSVFYIFSALGFCMFEPLYLVLTMKFIFGPVERRLKSAIQEWNTTLGPQYGIEIAYVKEAATESITENPGLRLKCCTAMFGLEQQACFLQFDRISDDLEMAEGAIS